MPWPVCKSQFRQTAWLMQNAQTNCNINVCAQLALKSGILDAFILSFISLYIVSCMDLHIINTLLKLSVLMVYVNCMDESNVQFPCAIKPVACNWLSHLIKLSFWSNKTFQILGISWFFINSWNILQGNLSFFRIIWPLQFE